MYTDVRGLTVHATGQKSVDQLDDAIHAYLGARRDTPNRVQKLLADDPDCPLAHCLAGYLQMHSGKSAMAASAQESLAQATRESSQLFLSSREKLHIAALKAWIQGDHIGALQRWEAILEDCPRDILAIRLAQFMTSYLGNSRGICDSIERVFPRWDEKVPGYSYLLGCYAYGLEEDNHYSQAERMGRAAIEMDPHDLWAAHAVTHVMEMEGRPRDGIAWVAELENQWSQCNNFVFHLKWHCALFHLALQDFDRVLAVYDREIRAESTDEYLDIANAASVLWRLEQANVDIGQRWLELAERASTHIQDHLFVFADLHYMLAMAANPPSNAATQFLESCRAFAKTGGGTQAHVMDDVGLAIAQAIVANRQGAYAEAADHLFSRRKLIYRVGGSRAQRDTFEQLLIDSVIRAGRTQDARMLLVERTTFRPHDLWSWRTWATLADAVGNPEDAAMSRIHLHKLLGHEDVEKSHASR
jgi:tetratricopeptide (TPR) repeat protein